MLLVTKNQTNTLYLTLTEKCTLTSPYFLFVIRNRISNDVYYFVLSDVSGFTYRYNQFLFNESLYGLTEGFYDYEIYEQTSPTNTDTSLTTSKVETGVLKVIDTTTVTTQTYTYNQTSSIIYDSSPTS